ncbi:hypothetical protein CEP52_010459 [Fusarium oligoseptatum]|uniref:N-acetyltransferase domain-containing protein n=1 Tax=Fusarium oligoseptatum TaxID=2604345 RepID=A0A428T867_9HYPO|nr:hypothetical protein CEP52_010459 [Fusarium oligoseptatum]
MAYTVLRIDRSDTDFPSLVNKYKTLRLSALQQTPSAFSSTYEAESKLSDHDWIARLSNPSKDTFVVVDSDGEWVAQVTVYGPVSAEAYTLPPEAGQPPVTPDEDEEKWQMLSLYVLPSHRGKGAAKLLCQETIDYLRSLRHAAPSIRVRTMIAPDNQAACAIFGSLGFSDAGLCTLAEGLRSNGEVVPEGVLSAKYTTRAGIIMTIAQNRL